MKLLERIKKEIRPKDVVFKDASSLVEKINSNLVKSKVIARCIRGGSTAKGTFLKGDFDVDLFVIFDYSYKNKDISKVLYNSIKTLKPEIIHGSRDYFHIKKAKITYEIVPVLDVKNVNDVVNVTDMSPHHVSWACNRLNPRLRDEIRLTKKFCKAQKIYGAESYIGGFSGHVVDIMIIYYGSFLKLIKDASKWKPKVVIDVAGHWKNPLRSLDKSKTQGPIIIVDPVQPERNAAAAVSYDKFEKFVNASKEFQKNPTKKLFIEQEFDLNKIKSKGKSLIVIDIITLDGKTDVIGAKTLKAIEYIKKQLELNNFTIQDFSWKWNKKKDAKAYFLIKEKKLSETFVRTGPPIKEKNSCIAFKAKNKDIFEKEDRLYANIPRKYRKPKDLAKELIKDSNVKTRVKKIIRIYEK